jgi:hypothetical protein
MTNTDKKWLAPAVLSTILSFIYISSAPTTLPDADAGEFILLSKFGGVAHPPGYPLYVGILRLLASVTLFPSIVYQLSLFSVFCTVASAAVLFVLVTRLGVSVFAAFVGVFVAFSSPGIWRIATTVEPFALNLLLCSVVMFISLELFHRPEKNTSRLIGVLGLCFGLGFSNHHALVLFAPLALAAMLRSVGKSRPVAIRSAGYFFCAFLLGAVPVVTLWDGAADVPLTWGPLEDFSAVWAHLLRKDYGTFRLSSSDTASYKALLFFWTALPRELGAIFFCILTIGLLGAAGTFFSEKRHKANSWYLAASAFTLLLIGLGFFMLCNVDPSGGGETIVHRFFHLAFPLIALFIALGMEAIRDRVPREYEAATLAVVTFLICFHLQSQWTFCNRASETFAEVDVRNTFFLMSESEKPVLVTFSDAEILGALYGRNILGLGKGVEIVQPEMWGHDAYRWGAMERLGIGLHPEAKLQDDWRLALQAVPKDRDIYFSRMTNDLKAGWPGKLFRRVRLVRWYRDGLPADPTSIVNGDLASFSYRLERPAGGSKLSAWEAMLYSRYNEWFQDLATLQNNAVNLPR